MTKRTVLENMDEIKKAMENSETKKVLLSAEKQIDDLLDNLQYSFNSGASQPIDVKYAVTLTAQDVDYEAKDAEIIHAVGVNNFHGVGLGIVNSSVDMFLARMRRLMDGSTPEKFAKNPPVKMSEIHDFMENARQLNDMVKMCGMALMVSDSDDDDEE